MATVPLNEFKNAINILTTDPETVYTAPIGITTIVLLANAANVSGNTVNVTLSHRSIDSTVTELVYNFAVPAEDSAALVNGKIILQEGESLEASASSTNSIKLFLSILETSNE
jgi:hypothetical protein